MKTMFVILALLMSQTSFALGGNWMFSKDSDVAAAPAPTPAKKVVVRTEKKADKKTDAVADTSGVADGCSSDFAKAAAYFKAVNNVDLARIGEFSGGFMDFTSTNQFKMSGRSLILNVSIAGGMVNADVPVKVCKAGKRLTATLITSNSREGGTNQPQATIIDKVNKGEAPRAITLNVTRSGNNLNFSGRAGKAAVQATAAVR